MKSKEVLNLEEKNRNLIIATNIKKYIKENSITQKKLAEEVGISPSTMSDYMNLRSNPSHGVIQKIADYFGIMKSDIDTTYKDTDNSSIETIYNKLEPPRQKKVYNFAEEQLEKQEKENVLEFPNKEKIPTVHNSASAANPTELAYGDTVVEEEEFERVPNNADFAVPIIGDSMEPVIKNGQFVFVKEQPDVEDGEIAIVELDGDGVTCKEIYKDYENQTVILRSINDLYENRIVSPERIRIIGKVVF